jgi:hypothetical protein
MYKGLSLVQVSRRYRVRCARHDGDLALCFEKLFECALNPGTPEGDMARPGGFIPIAVTVHCRCRYGYHRRDSYHRCYTIIVTVLSLCSVVDSSLRQHIREWRNVTYTVGSTLFFGTDLVVFYKKLTL